MRARCRALRGSRCPARRSVGSAAARRLRRHAGPSASAHAPGRQPSSRPGTDGRRVLQRLSHLHDNEPARSCSRVGSWCTRVTRAFCQADRPPARTSRIAAHPGPPGFLSSHGRLAVSRDGAARLVGVAAVLGFDGELVEAQDRGVEFVDERVPGVEGGFGEHVLGGRDRVRDGCALAPPARCPHAGAAARRSGCGSRRRRVVLTAIVRRTSPPTSASGQPAVAAPAGETPLTQRVPHAA